MKEWQFHRIVFIGTLAIFIVSFIVPSTVSFRTNQLQQGYYSLWLIYGLAGIVVFYNISKIYQKKYGHLQALEQNPCTGVSHSLGSIEDYINLAAKCMSRFD